MSYEAFSLSRGHWSSPKSSVNLKFNLVPKAEFDDMFPFKKARYVESTGAKGNYIMYYVWDVQKNDLVRKRLYIPAKYKTPASQKAYAKDTIKQINKLLSEGFHIDRKKEQEVRKFEVDDSEKKVLTIRQAVDEFLRFKESTQ